jgi:Fe-S-cluster containining protein
MQAPARECGGCSLCCVVLRVDELGKLGGVPCEKLRPEGGCGIHATRPRVCRAYHCLWLRGGLEEADRPDQLGAVLDVTSEAGAPFLAIREASAGAFARAPRLREIAGEYRQSMPVRITSAADVLNPDRPYRVLLPGGEERLVEGETITIVRDGQPPETRRMPWLERGVRRVMLRVEAWRVRRMQRRHPPP